MRRLLLPVLFLATGCTEDWGYLDKDEYVLKNSHANVLRQFSFTNQDAPGVAPGFDLDGLDSPEGEVESCGHGDLQDPEGRTGVDNQLAKIWSALEPLVGEAVQALLQGAINEGRFLLMVELEGVSDLQNDKNVTLNIFRGRQDPEIGTLGLISPDQTYYLDDSIEMSSVNKIEIIDGVVEAGPISFQLPIDILEANFIMDVRNGQARFKIHEDGTMEGYLGGSIFVYDVLDELLQTDASEEAALVAPMFENNADMGYENGICHQFSLAFGFTGTTGYVIRNKTDAQQ